MQAAEAQPAFDYLLIFDGGSINNPGFGYGSYRLSSSDGRSWLRQVQFGRGITSNQAEYMALIAGLLDLLSDIQTSHQNPASLSLEVRGDSELVISQLSQRWRVRSPGLVPLYLEARRLLSTFGRVQLVRIPRSQVVAVLGH